MLYQPPFKSGDTPAVEGIHNASADAGYQNGNPAAGEEGSYIPCEAIEHTQREIVNAIKSAGITPAVNVLEQLAEGIARLASMAHSGTYSGSANAHVLTKYTGMVAPKALFDGMVLLYEPGHTNTDALVVNPFGLGSTPVVTYDGAALEGGEVVASKPLMLRYRASLEKFIIVAMGDGGGSPTTIESKGWLLPCRTVSTSNITLSGEQTINGVAAVSGNRVLVNGQTTGSQNGPYIVAAGAWTRATDFDANDEALAGASVVITEGVYADTLWHLATNDSITLGTTAIKWNQGAKAIDFRVTTGSISLPANTFTRASPSSPAAQPGTSTFSNGVFTCSAADAGLWLFEMDVGYVPGSVSDGDVILGRITGPNRSNQNHNYQGAGNQGNVSHVTLIERLAAGDTVNFDAFHLGGSGAFVATIAGTRIGS